MLLLLCATSAPVDWNALVCCGECWRTTTAAPCLRLSGATDRLTEWSGRRQSTAGWPS